MKKTVIKRRKRVPAASGGPNASPPAPGRLTEQAAAEALVSVGRVQVASGEESAGMGADDDDEEDEEPKRKRVRRGVGANGKVESAPIVRRRSTRTRTVTREPSPEDRDEDVDMDADIGGKRRRKGGARQDLLVDSRGGSLSRSSSRAALHLDRYGRGYSSASPALHSGSNVGGFDLPPLNAALGGAEMSHMVLGIAGARGLVFPTSAGYVGGTMGREFGSSYIRSGSAAPSRAHSPSALGNNFVLPPLHHHAQMYGNTSPHHRQPSPNNVPSIPELERHYYELAEEKRRLEEMLDKTDRLMSGVRRGMDELRELELAIAQQHLQQAQQQQQQRSPTLPSQSNSRAPSPPSTASSTHSSSAPAPAVPLARTGMSSARENVWAVAPIEASMGMSITA